MEFLGNFQIETFWQLLLAAILGAFIGVEREYKKKGAGLQTYSLVALGSCLFAVIYVVLVSGQAENFPLFGAAPEIIKAVATGIGFIGAGVIFRQVSGPTTGLTTAAGLWVVSAIGVAAGFQLYFLAITVTALTIVVLAGFGALEEKFFR